MPNGILEYCRSIDIFRNVLGEQPVWQEHAEVLARAKYNDLYIKRAFRTFLIQY